MMTRRILLSSIGASASRGQEEEGNARLKLIAVAMEPRSSPRFFTDGYQGKHQPFTLARFLFSPHLMSEDIMLRITSAPTFGRVLSWLVTSMLCFWLAACGGGGGGGSGGSTGTFPD